MLRPGGYEDLKPLDKVEFSLWVVRRGEKIVDFYYLFLF